MTIFVGQVSKRGFLRKVGVATPTLRKNHQKLS